MRPFEEAKHLPSLFRQMDKGQQLKLVERIREKAISILEPITTPGYDLKNFDHAIIFCLELRDTPATIPFRDALSLLRACTSVLESGNIDQRHIDWIVISYAGLDKRLTGGETDWANVKAEFRKIATELLFRHDVEVGEAYQGLAPQTIESQRQSQQNTNEIDSQKEKKNFFHHDGQYWKVGYEGEKKTVPALHGMKYIAYLIEKPRTSIPCRELYQARSGKVPDNITSEGTAIGEGLNIGSRKQGVSDYGARQNYEKEYYELQNDLDNAESEMERQEIEKEMKTIISCLKERAFPDKDTVRCQSNIQRRLKKAYEAISKAGLKEMEKHLRAHIKTDGTYSLTYTGSAAWEITSTV